MRAIGLSFALIALAGCALQERGEADLTLSQPIVSSPSAAPFNVPMDPGAIRCQSLGNPAALAAATNWAMGQARARVVAGQTAIAPDQNTVSSELTTYCNTNTNSTIRSAVS